MLVCASPLLLLLFLLFVSVSRALHTLGRGCYTYTYFILLFSVHFFHVRCRRLLHPSVHLISQSDTSVQIATHITHCTPITIHYKRHSYVLWRHSVFTAARRQMSWLARPGEYAAGDRRRPSGHTYYSTILLYYINNNYYYLFIFFFPRDFTTFGA